jgi:hypothetical protein
LIWFAPSNYELWVFFTLTLGDSYFPFLAYSCFPITTNPDGSVQGMFRATGVRPKVYEKMLTYGITLSEGMFDPGPND